MSKIVESRTEEHVLRIPEKAYTKIMRILGYDFSTEESNEKVNQWLENFILECIEQNKDPHIEIIKFALTGN